MFMNLCEMQDIQFCVVVVVVVGPYCTSTEDGVFHTFFRGDTASICQECFAGGFIWLCLNVKPLEIFTC